MKKKIDIFWYWFLIIVAFVICFMFSSTKINAAISSGGSTGNDNTVVLPDDGIFEPCISETGCNLTDEAVEQVNLYNECHTYITTNIISNESLLEALNGKIYTTFTQEDCMEMINIASKREVIKNMFDVNKTSSWHGNVYIELLEGGTILIHSSVNSGLSRISYLINVEVGKTYTFSLENVEMTRTNSPNLMVSSHGQPDSSDYCNFTPSTVYYHNKCTFTAKTNEVYIKAYVSYSVAGETLKIVKPMLELGSTATPYVSYDYHREYYQEGIDYADGRVNTNSTSYTQGVIDADNRVNTNSVNYKTGQAEGYEKANKEGKVLGDFIPSLLGGFGSFFLTLLNIDILGFNLLTVLGILITVLGIVVVIKFFKG